MMTKIAFSRDDIAGGFGGRDIIIELRLCYFQDGFPREFSKRSAIIDAPLIIRHAGRSGIFEEVIMRGDIFDDTPL